MNDYAGFVAVAYGVAFLTIGGVAARILLEQRRLRAELERFGANGQREDEGGAS
jgi:heme exporter protein CcmD